MYSMLPHKQNIVPPTQLCHDIYVAYNDGMLGAGKLQVWKEWATFHQEMGV
jgi:hypothetical protein